jgi:DNA repair protein RadA/Sms
MAKVDTRFVCQECGHESLKWMGRCEGCGSWNTLVEEKTSSDKDSGKLRSKTTGATPERLSEVVVEQEARLRTGVAEFDRVMGGGIMRGSLTLLAGAPGIGKSTLMTELGKYLGAQPILYVTGEESIKQVKTRAERLGLDTDTVYLFAETSVREIVSAARQLNPTVLVVDSIQTVDHPDFTSAPGSVTQVRESTSELMTITKSSDIATFIVGHVTKEGSIAGPRVLEHMVDTVLYFEGDRHHSYRILRAIKNRFGSTNEIGLFEMREWGLREVTNPSEIFLPDHDFGPSGSAVVCAMEGTRPLLVEIQALVTPTSYGTPQRTVSGFDMRRLQMLLAVLEKREGLQLSSQDVFINVAGGVDLNEPAVDLGVAVAVVSSFKDVPADSKTVLVGEIGLSGEVRSVPRIEQRLNEAEKLGFESAIVPRTNLKGINQPDGLQVTGVEQLSEVLEMIV